MGAQSSFFSLLPEPPLDAARMNPHTEVVLDLLHQFLGRQRRRGASRLDQELHDIGGQIVGPPRCSFPRGQAGQAPSLEGGLGLIEGRAGETEGGRCLTHRLVFDPRLAQHLVLHLQQVPRVEEIAVLEQGVGDALGPGIQRALLVQGLPLASGLWRVGHPKHPCQVFSCPPTRPGTAATLYILPLNVLLVAPL